MCWRIVHLKSDNSADLCAFNLVPLAIAKVCGSLDFVFSYERTITILHPEEELMTK